MSRYIDADKLVAWCMETYQMQSTVSGKAYVNALLTAVDSCPTADVVEVVRCKDCIHSSYYGKICHYGVGKDVMPDHYCRFGERKEK